MKYFAILFLLLGLQLHAQTIAPDLQNRSLWQLYGRDASNLTDNSKNGVSFWFDEPVALLRLKGYDFGNGVIEFDTRGRDAMQNCFVGFAFHIQNDSTYDAIYFRPFNFKHAESFRRLRSVQYISWPQYTWQKLRAEHPNQYEHPVTPVPEPAAPAPASTPPAGPSPTRPATGCAPGSASTPRLSTTAPASPSCLWASAFRASMPRVPTCRRARNAAPPGTTA